MAILFSVPVLGMLQKQKILAAHTSLSYSQTGFVGDALSKHHDHAKQRCAWSGTEPGKLHKGGQLSIISFGGGHNGNFT